VSRGRVYRRCTCRDGDGRQLGPRCPLLASDGKHGTYSYAVDSPRVNGRRKTIRRGGFPTRTAARQALDAVVRRYQLGVKVDDRETVGERLPRWLEEKRRTLKPTTWVNYRDYVEKDIIPALGALRLEALRHEHVTGFVAELEAAGRGATTIRRVVAVLSSALSDAVKQRRLTHNVCEHVTLPKVKRSEQQVWTAEEAVRFLAFVADSGDRLAEVFEVIIGTGLRRGEALAMRWPDIDIEARSLFIDPERGNLSNVEGHLMFTAPKTVGSSAGVGLSPRVVAALHRQAERQEVERALWAEAYEDDQLVFCRENGAPLRPEYVLRRFHELSDAAGLPRVRVHDLRHLAATLMLASGVPLPLASKMLRHSQVGITADLYGHLTREASLAAADSLGAVLDAAAAELAAERAMQDATTARPLDHERNVLEAADTRVSAGEQSALGKIRTCNLLIRSPNVLYPGGGRRLVAVADIGGGERLEQLPHPHLRRRAGPARQPTLRP
jgi:integrase